MVYTLGEKAWPMVTGKTSLGTVICCEILFPNLVRDLARKGARLFVNVSNDSWMDGGDGVAPRQHFSMAVFRAVETRRYLVRAAASGVSGFVNPYGETYALLPNHTLGTTVARVRARQGHTPYVQWGDSWIALGLAL